MDVKEQGKKEVVKPEEKKKRSKKPLIFLILILLIIGAIVWQSNSLTSFFKKNVLKTKTPKTIDSQKVTKRISTKDGGTISVKGKNGLYYSLYIAPGSLKQDTDISLTPLDEIPIEGFSSNPDPGVLVGPPGVVFTPPGTITIGSNPPPAPPNGGGFPGGGGLPGGGGNGSGGTGGVPGITGAVGSGNVGGSNSGGELGVVPNGSNITGMLGQQSGSTPNLSDILKAFSGNSAISPAPQGGSGQNTTSPGGNNNSAFNPNTAVVVIDGNGNIHLPSPQAGSNGSDTTVPVDGSGTVSPNSPDQSGAEGLANQAAANAGASGGCTDEFMAAAARVANTGNKDMSGVNKGAIERCKNERLEQIKNQCKNDRVLVKKQELQNLLSVLSAVGDTQGVAEVNNLLFSCAGQLQFKANWIDATSDGVIQTNFEANLCGFVDDTWEGKLLIAISDDSQIAATGNFKLPAFGGSWGDVMTGSLNTNNVRVSIPYGTWGLFDGRKHIDVHAHYVQEYHPTDIQMINTCAPAVPLPVTNSNQSGDDDLIPLKDLVQPNNSNTTNTNSEGYNPDDLPPLAPIPL